MKTWAAVSNILGSHRTKFVPLRRGILWRNQQSWSHFSFWGFKKKILAASFQIFMPFSIGKFVFRNSLWPDVKAIGSCLWEWSFFLFHFLLHVLTHGIDYQVAKPHTLLKVQHDVHEKVHPLFFELLLGTCYLRFDSVKLTNPLTQGHFEARPVALRLRLKSVAPIRKRCENWNLG